ncbi:MAG: hypothetical protein HS128_19830 [Ideonella sp.]|nr:hypothetical protein [Ideonella sp.]MCC7457777.1 hypothetical protein [Nitrospira sp.]
MDLSALDASSAPTPQPDDGTTDERGHSDAAWRVATQIGADVASPLTQALEQVHELQATGRIDRPGLHALVTRIEQARRAGMLGQQISRLALAQGTTRQQHESIRLPEALRELLALRQDELAASGVTVRQALKPAEVIVDATQLAALLNSLLDWALTHAKTPVELRVDMKAWPAHARLQCRFGHVPADQVPADTGARQPVAGPTSRRQPLLDCLSWQLLVQLACTMQLPVERSDSEADTSLTLEFPHTANDSLAGVSSIEIDTRLSIAGDSRPLAGSNLLVISPRREVRNQVRQAVSHLGLSLDFVSASDAAREFCQQGLPQAIVYESAVYDTAFDSLRSDLRAQSPQLAWVEITDHGEAFEVSSFNGTSVARVGRHSIADALPSALTFELAKNL